MKKMITAAFILALTSVSAMAMAQDFEKDNLLGLNHARILLNQIQANPANPQGSVNTPEVLNEVNRLRTQQQWRQNFITTLTAAEQPPAPLQTSNPQITPWTIKNTFQQDYDYTQVSLLDQLNTYLTQQGYPQPVNMPSGYPPAPGFPVGIPPYGAAPGVPFPPHIAPDPLAGLDPAQRTIAQLTGYAAQLSLSAQPGTEIKVDLNNMGSSIFIKK